ncbi:putative carboxymethylenebutenolidase [Candida viswanathii]|uniref:Putative carboxymethylenebutenolidase n=1 Tax=Candida viswanathii TaxID=5486 RepID=A0A367Y4F9_9ASCO|nr:putative carboxymethylenebutenolidase [Candida viswanathii]
MLIEETYHDVKTKDGSTMRIYVYHPKILNYPNAKFPGVVVYSEIYQVTGPVSRFAKDIAGQGFICAAPSSYHPFVGPEPLAYDTEGTDLGNKLKIEKELASYDEDTELTIDYLLSLKTCNGKIGATGMCLGGHLAFRAALDPRVLALVCFFPTDIAEHSLGKGENDDTLKRCGEIKGEVILHFGGLDNHVTYEQRTLIRAELHKNGVKANWREHFFGNHAYVRDESSKGRYDPALTKLNFDEMIELFTRTLKLDLGDNDQKKIVVEHVC